MVVARASRRLRTTVDEAFTEVMQACSEQRTGGEWINDEIKAGYRQLHELGWAHSIETWRGAELVGGLYGVSIGGLFAGESMFHRTSDASKVALVRLVDDLSADGVPRLLDVQWVTDHLASLGAVEISRPEYRRQLAAALLQPAPAVWQVGR
jgi:leucyl/phenylalanyl-tRNA--protein transferase